MTMRNPGRLLFGLWLMLAAEPAGVAAATNDYFAIQVVDSGTGRATRNSIRMQSRAIEL
jgi:hypothetical protein